MATPIQALREHGQSVWLDYIRRGIIASGELERWVRDGVITGITSNPTIFEKAVSGSSDYDEQLHAIAHAGERSAYEAFLELAREDIRAACDALRPVYDALAARDGYVSLEVPPGLEHDAAKTVAEVKRLFTLVDRPNVMIKVPGTAAGLEALEELIAAGVNVNVTLLFSVDVYAQVAQRYVAGLERRHAAGEPVDRVAGVASFFVSRVDTAVDAALPEDSPLRGKAAVANAHVAYRRFREIFAGPRWGKLAAAGARVQRPLWASTGTKNPAYSDVLYVEELVARDTVNTMPEATLTAFLDHGRARPAIEDGLATAEGTLARIREQGIDMSAVTARLLDEGLDSFARDFHKLLDRIEEALHHLPQEGRRRHEGRLGPLTARVDERLAAMAGGEVVRRVWDGDHTVWKPDPTEISDRLGWLTVIDSMIEVAPVLSRFAAEVADAGLRHCVLLGMGGSSLAPEVLHATFGSAPGALDVTVLDTTDPATILAVERELDLARTLFIVASKSGSTIETLSHFAYFWAKRPDGGNFITITDPGSALEKLGRERGFRRVFLNPADIGGRYSALSYFGLVPAALIGADVEALLDRAHEMLHACHHCVPAPQNPGAWLGAVMGEAALAGRDKLTLLLPDELSTLGYWIEQLIAESTGKEGKGILPIEGEPLGPPAVYRDDRLFVATGDHPGLAALEKAGHPIVRLPYVDKLQLGGEFFRWEFATAVAGHALGINPFDQPNVQEAKDATARILAGETVDGKTESLEAVLAKVRPGDYLAINAYLPRRDDVDARLQAARIALRDRLRIATTVGYGPRFLHSTGQLHKGGPNSGVFVQVVDEDAEDASIPNKPYTFGGLKRAQALGDLASLRSKGRRVARVTLSELERAAKG